MIGLSSNSQEPCLFSLVVVTCLNAGWWCSAFEFNTWSASELLMKTPSFTCLSKHFEWVDSTLSLKAFGSLLWSGWKICKCLENAFLSEFVKISFLWWMSKSFFGISWDIFWGKMYWEVKICFKTRFYVYIWHFLRLLSIFFCPKGQHSDIA